jgi:predicted dehydrogenase
VIANETAAHSATLRELALSRFSGLTLVEKPLFASPEEILRNEMQTVRVGYNLRFHPLVRKLAAFGMNHHVLAAHAYVGQYLASWRPHVNTTDTYSAHRAAGGGVLRDLSHELDYLRWTLGEVRELTAAGGRFGTVTVDSDDVFALLMRTDRCPVVTLQMNYLDRNTRREVTFVGDDSTLAVDFVKGTCMVDGEVESIQVDRDATYRDMHRAILSGTDGALATYEDGVGVVNLIAAAEAAAAGTIWVTR